MRYNSSSNNNNFKKLWNYSIGFYGAWIVHIGRSMHLFNEIAVREPISINSLILKTGFYAPAVRAWCSAAVSFGLIKEKNGKLMITKQIKNLLLDIRNPKYLGGQFSYLALRSLDFSGLDDLFRSGKTTGVRCMTHAIDEATDWEHFAFLSYIRKSNKNLNTLLARGCKVLDVGCGTGTLIEKMHAVYPKSDFTGIEPLDHVAKIAQEKLTEKNEDIRILNYSGESMDFSNEFDLIYLGESLYLAKDKQKVIFNCHRALKTGRTIAILEGLIPESKSLMCTEENKLIMGMQLDFTFQGHQFMNKSEIIELLKSANFSKVKLRNIGGAVFIVIAKK
jgi:tRNA (cmo5U34)-methyltransferase